MKQHTHWAQVVISFLVLGGLVISPAWAREDLTATVSPHSRLSVTFSTTDSWPVWSLTVTPATGYKHKSVAVNSSRWTTSPGGGCGQAARFKCYAALSPEELQFQDRIFSGELEPCCLPSALPSHAASVAPVDNTWVITGKTTTTYCQSPSP